MIGSMIASQFSSAQNWPLGSAMAVLMIGAVLASLMVGALIVWVFPWGIQLVRPLIDKTRRSMRARSEARVHVSRTVHIGRFELLQLMLAIWTVLVLLFLFIPIALVVLHSFNSGSSFTIWAGSTTFKWWDELLRGLLRGRSSRALL